MGVCILDAFVIDIFPDISVVNIFEVLCSAEF